MNDLAIAFLERWIEENVSAVPGAKQTAEAERLAAACIRDAAEEDITEDELNEIANEETDGDDLVTYMSKAIDKTSMEELDELAGEDEEPEI